MFGKSTHDCCSDDETNEVSHRWPRGNRPAARGIGVKRQAHHAKQPIQQLAACPTPRPKRGAGEQHCECLSGNWNGGEPERNSHLGEGRSEERKSSDERDLAHNSQRTNMRTRQHIRQDEIGHRASVVYARLSWPSHQTSFWIATQGTTMHLL